MPTFPCSGCGSEFSMPDAVLAKYPGWIPKQCMPCRDKAKGGAAGRGDAVGGAGGGAANGGGKPARRATSRPTATATENLPLAEILARYHDGPQDGVFTDGGANPNPGPGGWGVVWARNGDVVAQRHGHDPHTTNNRMELTALIEAFKLVPPGESPTIYCDSELAVKTAMEWARMWERAGWKRKTGPIKNLELVQELWSLVKARPDLKAEWVAAHNGWRWNEYADSLASAHARDTL